jgi:hypothetical protein
MNPAWLFVLVSHGFMPPFVVAHLLISPRSYRCNHFDRFCILGVHFISLLQATTRYNYSVSGSTLQASLPPAVAQNRPGLEMNKLWTEIYYHGRLTGSTCCFCSHRAQLCSSCHSSDSWGVSPCIWLKSKLVGPAMLQPSSRSCF